MNAEFKEKMLLPWKSLLGRESKINLLGKIVLFPFIFLMCFQWSLLTFLFEKRGN